MKKDTLLFEIKPIDGVTGYREMIDFLHKKIREWLGYRKGYNIIGGVNQSATPFARNIEVTIESWDIPDPQIKIRRQWKQRNRKIWRKK